MSELLTAASRLERVSTGSDWAEGPCWLPDRQRLRWSDVVGNRILEFDPADGVTSIYAEDVEYVNGRTLDRDGTVLQCSHGRRRIERDDHGLVQSVVDRFGSARFNSPNDIVADSAGAIWFTDPPYGLHKSGREGHPGTPEYDGCFVFRFDQNTGGLEAVITDMVHPNGLAFSPDESVLYVADTGYLWDDAAPGWIRAYDIVDGRPTNPRVFAEVSPGAADGFRVDEEGRIWSSSRDAVRVFDPDGRPLLVVPVPETVSNLCFGGPDGHDLYITATTSLYRLRTTTRGAEVRHSSSTAPRAGGIG